MTAINLIENGNIVSDSTKCAEIINNYFTDAVKNLDIDRESHTTHVIHSQNLVDNAIKMFIDHPSILRINTSKKDWQTFCFQHTTEISAQNLINNLDTSKSYQKHNIPPKILNVNSDICTRFLCTDINQCIDKGIFKGNLKHADITPIYKKGDRLEKLNYRPIRILPTLSKIYEKVLYQQIYEYFNGIFSKYLCGFREGYSTQHCLLFMLERLKKALDKGLITGILLTDLSKAFDCISHELLIAKLKAYGFTNNALNLINDYLTKRIQRTKIGECFSTWKDIIFGVPQGSILGALIFNIYLNDFFLFTLNFDVANYADDNSPYEYGNSIDVANYADDNSPYEYGNSIDVANYADDNSPL